MKKKVFNFKKFLLFIMVLIIIVAGCMVGAYFYLIGAPSSKSESVNIYVSEGSTYSSIGGMLKDNNLIRSELAYKIYIKLNPPKDLEFGDYILKTNYDLEELITTLEKGSVSLAATKRVTFTEGKNMRYVIKTITDNFEISEEEILKKLSNEKYLDELISEYWFLTDEIKNKNIYYSLEGYLFPDTYEFYASADVDDIFRKMLDNMENKIDKYKNDIGSSKYSFHEMLTLASIIEQEAGNAGDRSGVAGVFYNRLNDGWSLGSDVTTYYAEKIDNFSRDLKQSELSACNSYNTRSSCMAGKLPVGPICNPGIESITATINPTKHKYYYFVADKTGKTYFNETDSGHVSTVNRLKREGLWIEYN